MEPKVDRAQVFKAELYALCKKHRCGITASDHWLGYAECGEDIRMIVEFDWDTNEEQHPDCLDLGSWLDWRDAL